MAADGPAQATQSLLLRPARVFDATGALCAQAAHIPVHLGSMAFAMRGIVAGIDWQPGDQIMLNDPYLGGTHLPDVTVIAPVFAGGRLRAFVVNRAHHADIGATSPGSMPISSRLVVNQAALKLKREPIRTIIDAFESAVGSQP